MKRGTPTVPAVSSSARRRLRRKRTRALIGSTLLGVAMAATSAATAAAAATTTTTSSSYTCPLTDGSSLGTVGGVPVQLECGGILPVRDVLDKTLAEGEEHARLTGRDGHKVHEVYMFGYELGVVYSFDKFQPTVEGAEARSEVQHGSLAFHLVDAADAALFGSDDTCDAFVASDQAQALCQAKGFSRVGCVAASDCRLVHSQRAEGWYDACADECGLGRYEGPVVVPVNLQRRRHVKATWDFEDGLDGWANASSSEMEAEVYNRGGELRGVVTGKRAQGSEPHVDSPRMAMTVDDRHTLVFRMLYSGPARQGRAVFRTGAAPAGLDKTDHGRAAWKARPARPTAVRWSEPSFNAKGLVDGSTHTGWTADTDTDAWVILDLGGYYEITELDIVLTFKGDSGSSSTLNAPKDVRLQKAESPDAGEFTNVFAFSIVTNSNHSRSVTGSSYEARVTKEYLKTANADSPVTARSKDDQTAWYRHADTSAQLDNNTFSFSGFSGFGRYFRLYCVNNFGGGQIEVRELRLRGPEDTITSMDFDIKNDGKWHTYAVPFWEKLNGLLTQVRVYPAIGTKYVRGKTDSNVDGFMGTAEKKSILTQFNQLEDSDGFAGVFPLDSPPPRLGNAFAFDWIRVAVAPTLMRITGCLNQFYENSNLAAADGALIPTLKVTNDFLVSTTFEQAPWDGLKPFATTYNCLRGGGEVLTLQGTHMGSAGTNIYIAGQACRDIKVVVPEYELTCVLAPLAEGSEQQYRNVEVRLTHGDLPLLSSSFPYLSFQVPPPISYRPALSNIAARSLDVTWQPPGDVWDHLTVTGYVVRIREIYGGGRDDNLFEVTVGNVTTTTIIGLLPDTLYGASVAAVCENQTDAEWRHFDLYGRRALLPNALIAPMSVETNYNATLEWDVSFNSFNANLTVNHSAIDKTASLGPSGVIGGEGSYGIVMVGNANVENCNESIACCDGYNASLGISSCIKSAYTCSEVGSVDPYYIDGQSTREVVHNDVNGGPGAAKQIKQYFEVSKRPVAPIAACGPALRLSASRARQAGSSWYSRRVNVREGFETIFKFRIAEGSLRCGQMDDTYTNCRARGGDGFAFVVQQQNPKALGAGGAGMGYTGIKNSLAVEFDTFYNAELLEPYENHIAVHSRGWRHSNNANHSYAIASSTQVQDMARDIHTARIVYRPNLDPQVVFSGRFEATAHVSHFLENADFPNGGMADWGTGMGQLEVYLDDLVSPVLVTPLNLGGLLHLYHGRAWVGFTGATGLSTWQTQDILSWHFNQLREDPVYNPPPLVNGVGAFACSDPELCVHL